MTLEQLIRGKATQAEIEKLAADIETIRALAIEGSVVHLRMMGEQEGEPFHVHISISLEAVGSLLEHMEARLSSLKLAFSNL